MSTTPVIPVTATGFRPPSWPVPSMTLYVPAPTESITATQTIDGGASSQVPLQASGQPQTSGQPQALSQPTLYVFDGVIRAEHQQRLVLTKIPVQTQAAVTDHYYLEPATITVEIAMSDAMQSYVPGQFSGDYSRSVNAYSVLLAIQGSGALLQVGTKLNFYDNMLISDISADEEQENLYGLKAMVTFQQVLLADIQQSNQNTSSASSRPQTTGASLAGQTQNSPVPDTIVQQHSASLIEMNQETLQAAQVPGAGGWSGPNISNFPPQ